MLSSSLLGHKLGDPPAPWFDAATNACGGILYIVTGALVVDFYTNALGPPPARDAGLAMGSFSLITGLCRFIYLCWLCFGQAGNLGINLNACNIVTLQQSFSGSLLLIGALIVAVYRKRAANAAESD